MKRIVYLFIISAFVSGCATSGTGVNTSENDTLSAETSSLYVRPSHKINSINHRGWWECPENTLSAYKKSKENGFDMVECDVSFTKDNVPVLLHDDTIDRTSNGKGNIKDLTLAELQSYDFGSWKSQKYAGEKIPTLDEFASLCNELELKPYIELKKGASEVEAVSILSIVEKNGLKGKVSYISYELNLLNAIKEADPDARLGLVCNNVFDSTIEKMTSLKNTTNDVFVDCSYTMLDDEAINRCVNANIDLEVWTVDSEEKILKLNPYISGVTSNKFNAEKVWDNYQKA